MVINARWRSPAIRSLDAQTAYKIRHSEPRDSLPHETAKRRRPARPKRPPAQTNWALARPWLWLEIGGPAGTWFRSLDDALEMIRPEQLRRDTLPELVWQLRDDGATVHVGELRFLRHGLDTLVCRFGCLAAHSQDLDHALTPKGELVAAELRKLRTE